MLVQPNLILLFITSFRDFMKATYGGIDILVNNAGINKRDGTLAEQVIFL